MLIGAALIVRDEAGMLPECLASVAAVVDEVVVVDTGSTDETVAIAEKAGAKVSRHAWDGDFSAARNRALDLVSADWVLYIDADERLADAGGLRAALSGLDAVAGLVRFRPGRSYTRYLEHRIFRRRPDIRFRGVIHETIVPDITRVRDTEGLPVVEVPAAIEHVGYDGDQLAKHHRNLPLLLRQVELDPTRLYLWFHLGSVYDGLGRGEDAERAWEHGVALAREEAPSPSPIAVLCLAVLALRRIAAGRPAHDLVSDLRAAYADDPLTLWASARQEMADGHFRDAVPLLDRLAGIDPESLVNPVLAYDVRIFGEYTASALGACWFRLGRPDRAAEWFGRAQEAAPDALEYRVKREMSEAMAGRGAA